MIVLNEYNTGALLAGHAGADDLVELISGHSLRAGYATSAAARNMPAYRIQSHTRHKSAQMVAANIREADKPSQGSMVWSSEFCRSPKRAAHSPKESARFIYCLARRRQIGKYR